MSIAYLTLLFSAIAVTALLPIGRSVAGSWPAGVEGREAGA